MSEPLRTWLSGKEIQEIVVWRYATAVEAYTVGKNGVTRIERTEKSGEFSHIPYVRVWGEDGPMAEFSQHAVMGVYFTKGMS